MYLILIFHNIQFLKGKFYKTVVRPAIVYGSEWLANKDEIKMEVTGIRIFKWMVGMNRLVKIKNEYTRGSLRVVYTAGKMRGNSSHIFLS